MAQHQPTSLGAIQNAPSVEDQVCLTETINREPSPTELARHDKEHKTQANENAPAKENSPPRFVGFSNPETVLRGQPQEREADPNIVPKPWGHWVHPGSEMRDSVISEKVSSASEVERARKAYLDAVGVFLLPPRVHQRALLDIYFTYVHPLLPVLDKELFEQQFKERAEPRVLAQAICIIASKHDRSRDHLFLGNDQNPLQSRIFSKRLYQSVIAALEAKLEKNRIVLIQVLALLSLHSEGLDGAEEASMHLTQAIHHAHTFGLQFGRCPGNAKDEAMQNLFWCLWSLDKINSSIQGRPLIIHERDNKLDSITSHPEKRKTAFGVWLQLSEALDKVIAFYRPCSKDFETGWELDFPGFEDIIGDSGDHLDSTILGS